MNPNCERISRKAERIQWDGTNTVSVMGMLARKNMIVELYRGGEFILVYHDGCMLTSMSRGTWVLIGEDERVRFYSDADMQMMYQPINDELDRLRAFAREIISYDSHATLNVAVKHGLVIPRKHGLGCDLTDSLKAPQ
jgi:hypothetical protein